MSETDPQMQKRLKEMKERFARGKEEAKKNAGGGTTLTPDPRVKYLTRLSKAKLVDTDDGPAIVLEFTCIDGDQTGEKATLFMGMNTDEKVGYMLRDLRRLGYEIDDLQPEELPDLCDDMNKTAPVVKIKVVEKGNYINTYIDKLVPLDQGTDTGPAVAPDDTPPAPAPAAPKKPAPTAPAAAKAAAPAPAAAKPAAKPAGTASAASKPAPAKLPPPEPEEPQEAAPEAEEPAAEEAVEEVAEDTGPEALEVGTAVSFFSKGSTRTGKIHKILEDGKTVHVRADENQKLVALDLEKNKVLALVETATE
jgi:hypothetical protein